MNLRQILFRAMLWSLGLSAAFGVLAVLIQTGDLVWRIVGTGITTAVACALMLPTSMLIDREKTRPAGLLGMSVIIVEFVLAQVLIWEIPQVLGLPRWHDNVALTMVFVALATMAVMLCLRMSLHALGRIAGPVGIVVALAWLLLFLIPTWAGRSLSNSDNWWFSGTAVIATGALAFLSLIGTGSTPKRAWRIVGPITAAIAATLWLTDIWIGHGSDLGFIVFVASLAASIVVGHANLVMFCPLTVGQRWLGAATIVAMIVTAILVDLIAIHEECGGIGIDEDIFARLASAAGILAGCGSLALCVLARMNRKVDFDTPVGAFSRVVVVCPRCRKKQPIDLGDSSCGKCGLRITIRVEEPRCPQCDYLLIGLTSDRCPECGLAIRHGASSA